MVKFPQPGLLLKLLADAFLVTQLADKNTDGRDGSQFRDELKELAAGSTFKNFGNCEGYFLTQLGALDTTFLLKSISRSLLNFYRELIRFNNLHYDLTEKRLNIELLRTASMMIAAVINENWHNYYAPTNQLAKKVHVTWFLPDFQKNESGLGVFFRWLENSHNLTRYEIAKNYDDSKKLNSDDPGSALRSHWSTLSKIGEFGKANLQTFEKLEEALWLSIKDKGLMDEKRLQLNLLLARGFDYLLSELQKNFTQNELPDFVNFTKELVTQNINSAAFSILIDKWESLCLKIDGNKFCNLHQPTDVETKKSDSDEKTAQELFDFFEKNPPIESLKGLLYHYRGRFYVLSGQVEKGLEFYKQAFSHSQFFWGGKFMEKVIMESLALSAFLGKDRRFFAEVYYYAALIGLFDFPEEKELDRLFHEWTFKFNDYFPVTGYYPSIPINKKEKMLLPPSLNGFTFIKNWDDYNKAADKKTKTNVNFRPKSQLQNALSSDKTAEDIIKLINDGADINFIDNSGGTFLIELLQEYYGFTFIHKNEKYLKIINRLFEEDLSKIINSVTKGKGITALSLAIRTFDLEMIERLIKKGADVKIKCNKPELSYIYYVMMVFYQLMESPTDYVKRKSLSKNSSHQNEATSMMENMIKPSNLYKALEITLRSKYKEQGVSEDKTVVIIKLLLENGASPDGHFINRLTPLMYATELNLTKVVEVLLDYKADAQAVNSCGKKVIDYAIGFRRPEIQRLLVN